MCPFGRPDCFSGTPYMAYMPKNLRSSGMAGLNLRYSAGMIWSVSTLSPSTYALPDINDSLELPFMGNRERFYSLRPLADGIEGGLNRLGVLLHPFLRGIGEGDVAHA